MSTVAHWKAYWDKKSLAGFRYEDEDHYQRCASELRVLFHDLSPRSVLEIGCGNGALYEYLGFDRCQYRGIDFSCSMLQAFRERYQGVELICEDGAAYCDDQQYDLIFSNGVLQHFDRAMLKQHFANARAMMGPRSLFISASIPWSALRLRYLTGELRGGEQVSLLHGIALRALGCVRQEGMGYWYAHRDFRRLAEQAGMRVSFHGCIYYPYRFHAVMQLATAQPR